MQIFSIVSLVILVIRQFIWITYSQTSQLKCGMVLKGSKTAFLEIPYHMLIWFIYTSEKQLWPCLWCCYHDVWHWLQNLEYIFWRKCICSFEDPAMPHNIPHYFRILSYQEDYLTFFLFIICKLHWQARIFYILCKSYCLWCVTFKGTKVESNTQKIKYTIMGK